jgi:hypothetical protein
MITTHFPHRVEKVSLFVALDLNGVMFSNKRLTAMMETVVEFANSPRRRFIDVVVKTAPTFVEECCIEFDSWCEAVNHQECPQDE